MQRLTVAHDEGIVGWTASAGEFERNLDAVRQQASMILLVSQLLRVEGMVESDDEDYVGYCQQLAAGARQVLQSVPQQDAGQARKGVETITRSCDACHRDYRS
jgi:hypothetical protein